MTTRSNFDAELKELQDNILKMGSLVEKSIINGVHSLATQDLKLAREVIDGDEQIDDLELEIENECLKLIATQQPMAKDLRRIATALKIIVDLERMADYASSIAKITVRLSNESLIKPLIDIPKMANIAQSLVKGVLDAYVQGDPEKAKEICIQDDQIDKLYRQIFDELLDIMRNNPKTITQSTYLLLVARYLERLADHATNIAESVVFLETGKRLDLNQ